MLRPTAILFLLMLLVPALSACQSEGAEEGSGDSDVPLSWFGGTEKAPAPTETAARDRDRPSRPTSSPDRPRGWQGSQPGVVVTWEALEHERYLLENPRIRTRVRGQLAETKIVLVNESHPEADGMRSMAWQREQDTGHGVLKDGDMTALLKGLEKIGYFKAAHATNAQTHLFGDARARGRVTVERGGQSVTLISMRGQGLNPSTKHVPGIYSQAKQAIAMLRNRAPTLSVSTDRQER